ncbi:hypothetical protein K431DRAFT_315414 [Polychaeton citri CBS 116435]|uniref:Ribosome assembly protein 3 n=1 Tax=Polychaeton citri CBS 116435 TaxID=1314669 RepID=A0A9P4PZM1_9PEZI|nr:hypothetical protein K431DRAFT_315414 [Polychaeton citri CBS 116435]
MANQQQQRMAATASNQADAQEQQLRPVQQVEQDKAFEAYYLQQLTKEFANDLDKLRSAGDFREQSLGVLIAALNQGTACFSKEERARIGDAQLN